MQDIVLIGTIMVILTSIYMLPIASLHNVPSKYMNRLLTILIPEVVILVCLHVLLLQIYHFMEHSNTPEVYIAFGVVCIQIALIYGSIFNHWGLSSQEVEESVISNPNTSLQPSSNYVTLSGLIHITSLFLCLIVLTVIN